MAESVEEGKSVRWAKGLGARVYKFKSPSQRGVQDRIFVFPPEGVVIFCEFKDKGRTPTRLQNKKRGELIAVGANAIWADSFESFKAQTREILQNVARQTYERTGRLPASRH